MLDYRLSSIQAYLGLGFDAKLVSGMAKKNPAAVSLGKLRMKGLSEEERIALARSGGLKGGKTRAASLTKSQRADIAKKAAAARWGKKRTELKSEEEYTAAVPADGTARLTKLTPEQRSEIARKAGKAGGRGRKKAD